jgi:Plasmid pRiA4b ORF-3-like protein
MSHKLKITLEGSEPKIYRTVVVPEKFTFDELHYVIQNVMNWENYHMYQFNVGRPYSSDSIKLLDAEEEDFGFSQKRHKVYDAEETYLSDFFNGQYKKLTYTYDFGDDWFHTITPFKKPMEEVLLPKCINGENAAPIEDCGGIWDFNEVLEIIGKKRKTAEEKEMIEWYGIPKGQTYDDVYGFNIDEINEKLTEFFREENSR